MEEDGLLWCEDCGRSYPGPCEEHGGIVSMPDNPLPSKARLSLPQNLALKPVVGENGQKVYGVFAKRVVSKRTQFGPLEAHVIRTSFKQETDKSKELNGDPMISALPNDEEESDPRKWELKIFHDDRIDHLDLTDENLCNWMMLVQPAKTKAEQNMYAHQYQQKIYFVTTKMIHPGTELKIWFAGNYAEKLGKKTLQEETPVIPPLPPASSEKMQVITPEKVTQFQMMGDPEPEPNDKLVISSVSTVEDISAMILSEARRPGRPRKKRVEKTESFNLPNITAEMWICSFCDESFGQLHELENHQCNVIDDELINKKGRRKGRPRKFIKGSRKTKAERRADRGVSQSEKPQKVRDIINKRQSSADKQKKSKRVFSCEYCGDMFSRENLMIIHSSIHTGQKPYICPEEDCSKGFTSKFKLQRHMLIHAAQRCHKCPYCDKAFNRRDHLKNHMHTHDPNKRTFDCNRCGKQYHYSFTYRTHMALHAAEAGETTVCTICYKDCGDRDGLLYHIKVHSGARSVKNPSEKNQKCPHCDKVFFTQKDVRRHSIVHSKKKDYLCQFCPQRFGRRDHLTRHIKSTHFGDPNKKPGTRERKTKLDKFTPSMVKQLEPLYPLQQGHLTLPHQPTQDATVPVQIIAVTPDFHISNSQSTLASPSNDNSVNYTNAVPYAQVTGRQSPKAHVQLQSLLAKTEPLVEAHTETDVTSTTQLIANQIIQSIQSQSQLLEQPNQPQQPLSPRLLLKASNIAGVDTFKQPVQENFPLIYQYQPQQSQSYYIPTTSAPVYQDIQISRDTGARTPPSSFTQNSQIDSNTQGNQYSTLVNYMETLRFLENLPTNSLLSSADKNALLQAAQMPQTNTQQPIDRNVQINIQPVQIQSPPPSHQEQSTEGVLNLQTTPVTSQPIERTFLPISLLAASVTGQQPAQVEVRPDNQSQTQYVRPVSLLAAHIQQQAHIENRQDTQPHTQLQIPQTLPQQTTQRIVGANMNVNSPLTVNSETPPPPPAPSLIPPPPPLTLQHHPNPHSTLPNNINISELVISSDCNPEHLAVSMTEMTRVVMSLAPSSQPATEQFNPGVALDLHSQQK